MVVSAHKFLISNLHFQDDSTRSKGTDSDSKNKKWLSWKSCCVLCRETFLDALAYRRHLFDNPECKKIVQEYNKKRREERKRGKTERITKLNEEKEERESNEDTNTKSNFKEKCPICLDVYSVEVKGCSLMKSHK